MAPNRGRAARHAKMTGVNTPAADALLALVRALPAAGPLLAAVGDTAGVYLVGGAVRDLLRGEQPLDLDLVVERDEAADLAHRLGGTAQVHDRFGTSSVSRDDYRYDIARARRETYSRPGALPEVVPATLAEDLERRDFTVNAMAVSLGGPRPGALAAVPGAQEDLDARRLRVLHDASFLDDPTRLFRLVRYASRLPFAIEPHTRQLADEAVAGGALATVSGPRVGAELRLLAAEPDPLAALEHLRRLGLDAAIHPHFGLGLGDRALGDRALALLPDDGRRSVLALALASLRVPPRELGELLDRLAFDAAERETIVAAVQRAAELATALKLAELPSEIADAVAGASPELVAIAGALGPAAAAQRWLGSIRQLALEIGGTDLIEAGVAPGPAIGRGLRAALAAKRDGRAWGPEAELAEALRAAGDTG
jgi:tRNA nucleotidyltransferase (CCA-adding enzyme)